MSSSGILAVGEQQHFFFFFFCRVYLTFSSYCLNSLFKEKQLAAEITDTLIGWIRASDAHLSCTRSVQDRSLYRPSAIAPRSTAATIHPTNACGPFIAAMNMEIVIERPRSPPYSQHSSETASQIPHQLRRLQLRMRQSSSGEA